MTTFSRVRRKRKAYWPSVSRNALRTWSFRIGRRAWLIVIAAATLVFVLASPAYADPEDLSGGMGRWGGPGADLEDSRGLPVWVFDLYLDDGDATTPGQVVASGLARLSWGIYRAIVATAIWLVNWVLQFDWLATLTEPVAEIADSIELIIARFGLTATLLTITAFVAGMWMLKGAWSLGLYELVVSLALASLAVGVLSDPVDLVAGDDGYIVESAQIGLQLSDGIVNGPDPPEQPPCSPGAPCPVSASPDGTTSSDLSLAATDSELLEAQTQNLVDVFIRMPQQAVNFGQIIDGTGCESEYDDWMEAEIDGDVGRIDRIGAFDACNPDASAYAQNPGMGLVITAATITPGAIIILLFAVLIAGITMWCAVWVLFQSVKAVIALVVALLPGNNRNVLWSTIAEVLVWLGLLIFSLVFLAVYLVVVSDLMTAQQDMGTIAMFLIVDIILLLGLIAFWRARGSIAKMSDRLTQTMRTRPGRKPTVMAVAIKQAPPDQMANTVTKTTQVTTKVTKSSYRKVRDSLGSSKSAFSAPAPTQSSASSRPNSSTAEDAQTSGGPATSTPAGRPGTSTRQPTYGQKHDPVGAYRAARKASLRGRLHRTSKRTDRP